MPENQDGLRLPIVVATTLPFFARATTIVDEVWHDLDRMAGALDQRAAELSADSADCAILELMTSGIREVARRLEQAEVALSAYLPGRQPAEPLRARGPSGRVKFRGWLAMRALFSALLRAGVVVALLFVAIPSRAADGFYLVAPPAVPSGAAGGNAVNLSAPLSSWERRGFYDASAACFSALNAYRIKTRSRLQGSSPGPEAGSGAALLEQTRAEHARCLYANDPRLK